MIERCLSLEQPGWLVLREALWPHCSKAEQLAEMSSFLAEPQRFVQLIAYSPSRQPMGFAEASVRHDYVNGTSSSPVAFLEGLYVSLEYRRTGVAAALVGAVAAWGVERGCREFASDASLENELSHAVHKSLGFQEAERVVLFRKKLP